MLLGKDLNGIKMVVEDSGSLDIALDNNLIWGEVVWGRTEVEVKRERRVDGRLGWKPYQETV